MFDPGLSIGETLKNADIVEIFKCGNMGGMRRSKETNTLVLITDYSKGIYHDKWIGGTLHYTGMGKSGDQDINWAQNATLAGCGRNGVDIHLFEVIDAGEYVYCGRIELVSKPYTDIQRGEDGNDRIVWMFPIRPVPENNVKKPQIFVFKDMEDYKARGKDVEKQYAEIIAIAKKLRKKPDISTTPVLPVAPPKPGVVIPPDLVGKTVKHNAFGQGVITGISDKKIIIDFTSVGEKKMGYEVCMKNKLLEII